MFKLSRQFYTCKVWYEQHIESYLLWLHDTNTPLVISSDMLKMDWDCSSCMLLKAHKEGCNDESIN